MVHYLCPVDTGIERYAETNWDTLDVKLQDYRAGIEYLNPDEVQLKSSRTNISKKAQGYHVKPECMPKKVLWANGSRPIPDVLPGFIVSPRFKKIVELFEPKVHQFLPVDIYKARKGSSSATHYWFIVGQRLDSVDRDHTTYMWKTSKANPEHAYWAGDVFDREEGGMKPIENAKLVFSNTKTSGRHIWHDPYLLTFDNGLCSDEMADALRREEFSGLGIAYRESV